MSNFRDRLATTFKNLKAEHYVGIGGLALLSACAFVGIDATTASWVTLVSGVGGNVAAGLLQKLYEKLAAVPTEDQEAHLQQLAQIFDEQMQKVPGLRQDMAAFLHSEKAFAEAEAVSTGDPAAHGWLLLKIYTEILKHHDDLKGLELGQHHMQRTLSAMEAGLNEKLTAIQTAVEASQRFGTTPQGNELAFYGRQEKILRGLLAVSQQIAHRANKIVVIQGDLLVKQETLVITEKGDINIYQGEVPVVMDEAMRATALGRYLQHVVARNRYLQLQGIRSSGRLVHIELAQIYITLRATQQRTVTAEERWLADEAGLAPGERRRRGGERETITETVTVSVNEALAQQRRLVVLGDPGSGKTTLLRYLALIYAQSMSEKKPFVADKLGLAEDGLLPILLPLRQIGAFLQNRLDEGTDGHRLLLEFLRQSLAQERIEVPLGFFDPYLQQGRAIILLDGMDEVAAAEVGRVARLVEALTRAYPHCRLVVTSRIVGYTGAARLGEAFGLSTVRDFSLADVAQFLRHWHLSVALGQPGANPFHAKVEAAAQTRQLLAAITEKPQIQALAINPLMLTVIALVHRDRVKLPDRRAELYAEAVDVLLGKWDEARGVAEAPILEGDLFDAGDKRLLLQAVALHMHEAELKEIEVAELAPLLAREFGLIVADRRQARRAQERFLAVVAARTGLLVARGEGIYAFSHLTFQEYLAALAVAARDDYVQFILARSAAGWWREVVLLTAGHLGTQGRTKTTRLIAAIADQKTEPEPYHNLVLAAECLQDVGSNRVAGQLGQMIQRRLRAELDEGMGAVLAREKWVTIHELIERRAVATQALVRSGAGYWSGTYGEPEWVEIPAGSFWLGSEAGYGNEKPVEQLHLERFWLARVPITNAQYGLFVQATGYKVPRHWTDGRLPKGKESHPVVNVSWHDAQAYCRWLSQVTGKLIGLPTEAQWEKGARGDKDQRTYPWGDPFDKLRCNSAELGVGDTTPVGIFPDGASPYGCLDMSGNVWEWTSSQYQPYPYRPDDGREDQKDTGARRVLRGGSWYLGHNYARALCRLNSHPNVRGNYDGFRVGVGASSPIL